MCYLTLEEEKYGTIKEYWTAVIINQPEGFTINDILKYKKIPSSEDTAAIHDVIRELGDRCLITRNENRFYISHNTFVTA